MRLEDLLARDPSKIAIGDRVYAAHALGRLTASEVELAKRVLDRGDKAVHEAPPSGVDVFSTVEALTQVVGSLCGGEHAQEGRTKPKMLQRSSSREGRVHGRTFR